MDIVSNKKALFDNFVDWCYTNKIITRYYQTTYKSDAPSIKSKPLSFNNMEWFSKIPDYKLPVLKYYNNSNMYLKPIYFKDYLFELLEDIIVDGKLILNREQEMAGYTLISQKIISESSGSYGTSINFSDELYIVKLSTVKLYSLMDKKNWILKPSKLGFYDIVALDPRLHEIIATESFATINAIKKALAQKILKNTHSTDIVKELLVDIDIFDEDDNIFISTEIKDMFIF